MSESKDDQADWTRLNKGLGTGQGKGSHPEGANLHCSVSLRMLPTYVIILSLHWMSEYFLAGWNLFNSSSLSFWSCCCFFFMAFSS